MRRQEQGSALPIVLVLLALVVGAGTWNYLRNYRADQETFRPYRSYSETQLDQLIQAYEADLGRLSARYEAARGRRAETHAGPLLGERVAAFERARRTGERVRALGGELSEREAALRDFKTEKTLREAESHRVRLFLRRLLTIQRSTGG